MHRRRWRWRLQQHLWGRLGPACGKLVPKRAILPVLVDWEQSPLHTARCYPPLHYGKGGRRRQILALWWFYARYPGGGPWTDRRHQHHTCAGSCRCRNRHLLDLHQSPFNWVTALIPLGWVPDQSALDASTRNRSSRRYSSGTTLVFSVISGTLIERVLLFCRGAVGVFYIPSRLGNLLHLPIIWLIVLSVAPYNLHWLFFFFFFFFFCY